MHHAIVFVMQGVYERVFYKTGSYKVWVFTFSAQNLLNPILISEMFIVSLKKKSLNIYFTKVEILWKICVVRTDRGVSVVLL